jgi:hypothetical protein
VEKQASQPMFESEAMEQEYLWRQAQDKQKLKDFVVRDN